MSRKDKLLNKLKKCPKDFTWDELCTLLGQYGYHIEKKRGKGSHTIFKDELNRQIRTPRPQPQNIIKPHYLKIIYQTLIDNGNITNENNDTEA